MLKSGEETPYDHEKDFVLFVDKEGKFSGNYEPPTEEERILDTKPQTAIDEETGEINWDCPCLQSALAPPCGEFFRDAFSCFVASKTEPKGSDCLEKFGAMQDCFRAHPEIYLKGLEEGDDVISAEQTPTEAITTESSLQAEEIKSVEEQHLETPQ
jgi:intermembrane space import and assembly protein 40